MKNRTVLRHSRFIVLVGFVVVCRCDCPFYHEVVQTYATLYLTLQNKTDFQIKAAYHRPRELRRGDSTYVVDSTQIIIAEDTLFCAGGGMVNDTIEYQFTSADYCYINSASAELLKLELKIFLDDTLYKVAYVLPWDTTFGTGYEELDNCHKESWDALVIE